MIRTLTLLQAMPHTNHSFLCQPPTPRRLRLSWR